MKIQSLYVVMIFCLVSCKDCKKAESSCTNSIQVRNKTNQPKVVWLSLLTPDTAYHCDYQKNAVPSNNTVPVRYGLGGCWEHAMSEKDLQLFVLDSTVYADSSCSSIAAHPSLYSRFIFSQETLTADGWTISIE